MNSMDVYYKLPTWVQNIATNLIGLRIFQKRYGKEFWKYLGEYEERDSYTYDELIAYQNYKLHLMMKHCYESVPYYKKLFDKLGITHEDIKSKEDLKILPKLTKDKVKEDPNLFISNNISKNSIKVHATGGTTGAGLNFMTTDKEEAEQWAVWWRYRRNLGINFSMWCGNFGGKTIVPINSNKKPFWRYNYPGKQIFFSGYHINDKNAPYYANIIKKRRIKWLHGYPSNLANLASCLLRNGITLEIDYVTIGSENLYDYQIELIEKAFKCTPYQHYGLTEGVVNISQKKDGNLYVDEDFSVVEFVPSYEKYYSVIGTTLTNYVMPLVRYDTGDQVIINPHNQKKLNGRQVESIEGRANEIVVLEDSSRVSSASLSLVFKDFITIKEAQIIQEEKNNITIKIVKTENYIKKDEDKLTRGMKERLGKNMNIKYEYIESIPRTKNGKIRLVISNI